MKKSILGLLLLVSISSAEFIRDNEIVTDTITNLQWQDDETAKSTKKTWEESIKHCENLNLGDHSDWHLPNQNELQSIVDRSVYDPAISSVFQNTISSGNRDYWSSTTDNDDTKYAWSFYFKNGYNYRSDKTYENFVRCVRSVQE